MQKRPSIDRAGNRHLRCALFMPTLSAVRCNPHRTDYYQALQARHKTKLHAPMAVVRKLLHTIYGIFKTRTPYDGKRLFPKCDPAAELQSPSR